MQSLNCKRFYIIAIFNMNQYQKRTTSFQKIYKYHFVLIIFIMQIYIILLFISHFIQQHLKSMEYPRKYCLLFFIFFIATFTSHLCYLNNSLLINYYHDFVSTNQLNCLPCYYKCITCDFPTSLNCTNSCEIGFYYNNTSCIQCPLHCNICNSSTCLQCANGFFLFNNICLSCSKGVLSCSISSNISCTIGYYYTSSASCSSCIQNCLNCSDSISCNSCNQAYYYNTSTSSCSNCGLGCILCFQYSICQTCLNKYLLNNLGTCNLVINNSCTSNCLECSSGLCLLCKQGYFLNIGICIQGASLMCLSSQNFDFGSCSSCSEYAYQPSGTSTYCIPKVHNESSNYIFLTSINNKQIFGNPSIYCDLIISPPFTKFILNLTLNPSYSIRTYLNLFYQSTISIFNFSVSVNSIYSTNTQNFSLFTQFIQQYCNTSLVGSSTAMNFSINYPNVTLQIENLNIQIHNFSIYQIFVVQYLCQVDDCVTCLSATICTSCRNPYLLLKNKCVSSCDSGYYTNYNLMKCELICATGYYTDLHNYQCLLCKPPCLTCLSNFECLSCTIYENISTYLDGFSCNSNCNKNTTYPNQINNTCSNCINPCKTCFLTGSNCTSCNNGYLYNNTCVGDCPTGTYGQFNSIIVCSLCIGCYTCQITATNCLSCSNSTVLFNNSCLSVCPVGFFNSSLICISCILPCKACFQHSQNCTSCSIGSLYIDINYNGLCFLNCPDNYYSSINNICVRCQPGCFKCISNSTCINCLNITINNSTTIYYLQNGHCVTTCTYGYYNSSNNLCSSCIYPCATCLADAAGNICRTCNFSFYLLNFTCVIICPIGYFQNNQTYVCMLCNDNCYTCSNNDGCDSCIPILLNNSIIFAYFNHTCINYLNCPTNLFGYKNISTGLYTCQSCNFSCYTCINYSVICTSCYKGMYFIQNQYSCVFDCPTNYYTNDSKNCFLCSNQCKNCQNNSYTCLNCFSNTFLFNNTCLDTCPRGFYQQYVNLVCQACISSCSTCESYVICNSCNENFFLYQYACISSCPIGYVISNSICQICIGNNCLSCFNTPINCTSCMKNTYLMINVNTSNSCLMNCPVYYYIHYFSQTCKKCISPCLTCISSDLCSSCAISSPQNYLYHYSCIESCTNGTYPNSISLICSNCTPPCLSCSDAFKCISCISGFFFFNSNNNTNGCAIQCPDLYYGNNLTNICQLCQIPCLTCKSLIYCLSCVSGYLFQNNYCISICLNGTYNDSFKNTCSACSSNCLTCYNTSNQCLTCQPSLIFYSVLNNCVKQCPSHYYAQINSITNNLQCQICSSLCYNCSKFSRCTSCVQGLFLQQYSCISQCSISYFNINGICQSCSQNCQTCLNSTFCTNCLQFFLYQNFCIVQCPLTFYPFIQNMTCLNCPNICNSCINQYYCTSCKNNYALLSNFCVILPCIEPYYYDSTNNSCIIQCSSNQVVDYINKICYIQCPKQLVLFQNTCIVNCPSDTVYFINNNIQCQKCSTNCENLLLFSAIPLTKNDQLEILIIFNNLAHVNNKNSSLFIIDKPSQNNRTTSQTKILQQTQIYIVIADINSISLNNIAIFINQTNPYRLITDSNQRVIQNWYTSVFILNYDYYGYKGTNALAILLLIFIGVLYLTLAYLDKLWMIWNVLDYSQLIYFISFFDFQLPPSLQPFLTTFFVVNFRFLPFYKIPQNILQKSPKKFYEYTTDINFLRNISSNLLILIIFSFSILILGIIFKYQFFQKYRKTIQNHWNKRFVYMFECFNLIYLNICLFSFLQYLDLDVNSIINSSMTNFLRFNIFLTIVFNVSCIILPFGILINVYNQFKNLKSKKMKNYYDSHVISQQKKQSQLHIFLEYMLTEINLQKKNISVFIQVERFFRKLTFAACLGLYPTNPIFVIIVTMLHTVVLITIVYIYQPYLHKLRNNTALITDLIFLSILFFIFMLFLNNNMSKQKKLILGGFIQCLLVVLLLMAMLYPLYYLYTLYRNRNNIELEEKVQVNQLKIQEQFCESSQNQVMCNQQIIETENYEGGINKINLRQKSYPQLSPSSDIDQIQVDTIIQK